ncbi:MAG: hypothetical protein A2X94_14685 [Bdellovibrionales bacterium GWB1_55_8]|nr:MAG: hypothetical protein A2X94_14685 [Bdellovibrionales bacterium GWB1_55_8]
MECGIAGIAGGVSRMGRASCLSAQAGLILLCLGHPLEAGAYTPTTAPNGAAVRWVGNPKLNFAGNPQNQRGFAAEELRASAVRGLQRWQAASGGGVSFDYWQGTDPSIYSPNSDYNGLSSIYFASAQSGSSSSTSGSLSPNVLGLTQVWYNTDTGEVLEADIVLNDRDFQFTSNVSDTSGFGTGKTEVWGGRNQVFIDNVLTHELGHAIGLSHAGGLQSTMLFMESPEQAFLSCDDLSAVRALYPTGDSGARGSLTGVVQTDTGAPLYGAHVLAISRRRGTVLASGLTDRNGRYAMDALEPGEYFIAIEPFLAGSQALPAFFSGIDPNVCSGKQTFARSFLTAAGGFKLQAVRIEARRQASAPAVRVRCTTTGGAAVVALEEASTSGSALVYDPAKDGSGFGVVDRLVAGYSSTYRMKDISGRLELHALSYTLYSPIRPLLSLYDSFGEPVDARIVDKVYVGESGFTNYDAAIVAEQLPLGDYYLEINGRSLNASLYPAGPVMLDAVPFLVVTGSMNEAAPALASAIPFNPRCRMSEAFPAYKSPSGNPPRRSTSGNDGGIGFCGQMELRGGGPPSGGPGAGAIAGWLLPWGLMIGAAQLMRQSARRRGSHLARL